MEYSVRHLLLLLLLSTTLGTAQPIGKPVTDFRFLDSEGGVVDFPELRSRSERGIVLLSFWCTTCSSCRQNEAYLAELARRFQDRATVMAVVSSREDNPETVKSYLKKGNFSLPILYDPGSELARAFGVKRTTTTLLMDRKGRLRYFGALRKGNRLYGEEALKALTAGRIIGYPVGPEYG